MTPTDGERATSHTISCSPVEWEMIREAAQQAGMSMSAFLLHQVRAGSDEAAPTAHVPGRIVLSAEEQHSLYAAVTDAAEWLGPDATATPDLAEAVQVLFDDALDDLIRTGRTSVAEELLALACPPERGRRILDAAQERYLRAHAQAR